MAHIERYGGPYWNGSTFSDGRYEWYVVTDWPDERIDCKDKADAERKLKEYRERKRQAGENA